MLDPVQFTEPESATLAELLRMQNELSQIMQRRFGRMLALCFTDIVESVEYFRRFGDVAGRALQQRHFDLVSTAIATRGGRLVDTAGDGAFFAFGDAASGAAALIDIQRGCSAQNFTQPREHHLTVRGGLHWGMVLTDGKSVAGDSVNLCARVAGSGKEQGRRDAQIRLTRPAFQELPAVLRVSCRGLPPVSLKGVEVPVELMELDWHDTNFYPTAVRCVETGQAWELPCRDLIGFGRIADHEGVVANDIVLAGPDAETTAKISRWQFELRRSPHGFILRVLSDSVTEVDGQHVPKGSEVPLRVGGTVRVARALTLQFSVPRQAVQGTVVTGFGG